MQFQNIITTKFPQHTIHTHIYIWIPLHICIINNTLHTVVEDNGNIKYYYYSLVSINNYHTYRTRTGFSIVKRVRDISTKITEPWQTNRETALTNC